LTAGGSVDEHSLGRVKPGAAEREPGRTDPKTLAAHVAFLLAATLVLCSVALRNGFPLLYHGDSGTYLSTGFDHWISEQRPIFYGLFLSMASLHRTLWLPVFLQALLLVWIIDRTRAAVVPERRVPGGLWTLMLVVGLATTTTICWTASFVLPDLLAPVTLLALALLVSESVSGPRERAAVMAALAFACVSHSSHMLVASALVVGIAAVRLLAHRGPSTRGLTRSAVVVAASWLLIPTTGLILTHSKRGFVVSGGAHAFMVARLAEAGLLQQFLQTRCPHEGWTLCDHLSAIPRTVDGYLWNPAVDSPFVIAGGFTGARKEHQAILRAMISEPHYVAAMAGESLRATMRLAALLKPLHAPPLGVDSYVPRMLARYLPADLGRYLSSEQARGALVTTPSWAGPLQAVSVLAGALLFGFFLLRSRTRSALGPKVIYLALAVAVGVFLNAWVCGTLASPEERRYQVRVAFLLPLMAALLAAASWRVRGQTPGPGTVLLTGQVTVT
jgi:hypothetical protein